MSQKFSSKYHIYILFSLLFINWQVVFSQVILQKFPKNNQVLQRNDQNEALLSVKGMVTENEHSSVSLIILKDGNVFYQNTINLDASKTFDFSTNIIAGKFDYTVKLYLDATREVKSATRVAVGDVFLIYGQSNALGFAGIDTYSPAHNPFIRYLHTSNYENGESEWYLPYETYFWPGTGAMELMKFLTDKYDYPVAVIQAFVGGADIKSLNTRTVSNPADKNNYYGKMILQTVYGDLTNQIKYIIFRHGESDAYNQNESQAYPAEFDKLYRNLVTDFPNLKKIYNLQTNILTVNNSKAGFVRDFQRKTKYLYPKISTMSTVGTLGHDGLHYTFEGYSQTAFELSRIIGKEIYHDNSSDQVYSPNIQRAFWENNKLVLEFENSMQMVYPSDMNVNGFQYQMKNYIYVDGRNDVVQSGVAIGNRIYLTVSNVQNAKFVSYLPSWFSNNINQIYDGVHLKNTLGMRAFSFDNITIGGDSPVLPPDPVVPPNPVVPPDPIIVPAPTPQSTLELVLSEQDKNMVKLSWNGNNQTKYHIERSVDNIVSFGEIATVSGTLYFDTQVNVNKTYYYRIFAANKPNEKSSIKNITLKCLDNIILDAMPNVNYVGANISIAAIITISKTKQLSLEAKKSIDLNHGFDAELGSDFSAEIGGCKNN